MLKLTLPDGTTIEMEGAAERAFIASITATSPRMEFLPAGTFFKASGVPFTRRNPPSKPKKKKARVR